MFTEVEKVIRVHVSMDKAEWDVISKALIDLMSYQHEILPQDNKDLITTLVEDVRMQLVQR